jgi:hypothetical protein
VDAELLRSNDVKYLLMIYENAEVWGKLSEQERHAVNSEGGRLWQELVASGEGIFAEPLADPADAHIVRIQNGERVITDGPFAEAKEQFVGFLMIDVASEERAIEIAASWPNARYSPLEVRLIRVFNATQSPST